MNDKTNISIIIPTYNRAYCILDSINSVLNQTYPYFELLIIDDGSTDNTEDIVRDIEDERVKYYKTPQNSGPAAARNYGVALAQYDYIAFQDSDDEWLAEKLDKQIRLITENPIYGLVYCQMKCPLTQEDYVLVPGDSIPHEQKMGYIYDYLLKKNYISTQTMLIKKQYYMENGGFDESLKALEDWDMVLGISKNNQIGYVDETLLIHPIDNADRLSLNGTAYYESRCKMLGKYKNDMIEKGVINDVMEDILNKANEDGILEQVGKLMELYLKA